MKMNMYVFVTNYYNHHQSCFAQEMDEQTAHNFYFIETAPMETERRNMGWGQEKKPNYVLQAYSSSEMKKKCEQLIMSADVVIWGSCPFCMVTPRLKKNKLTFAYSERIFKTGDYGFGWWGRAIKYFLKLCRYQNNHYLLCASAYAARDYNRLKLFQDKTLKWGYFTEVKEYQEGELAEKKQSMIPQKSESQEVKILWAGRLIGWKHPEEAIAVADNLRNEGYSFKLQIIGTGTLEQNIRSLISAKNLSTYVEMLGPMTPSQVREYMECADIFLFTSDQNEGWGAVLNEAMNSGCTVIARDTIGSVPFLLRNGENGFTYHANVELVEQVEKVIMNNQLRNKLGQAAYRTMLNEWNAHVAVTRLLHLIKRQMLPGEWQDGPISQA